MRKKQIICAVFAVALLCVLLYTLQGCGKNAEPEMTTMPNETEEVVVPVETEKPVTTLMPSASPMASAKPVATPKPSEAPATSNNSASAPGNPTPTPKPESTKPVIGGNSDATQTPVAPTATPAPSEAPVHKHSWTPVYSKIEHEEKGHFETVVVKAAYDEPVMKYVNVCAVCGATSGNDMASHIAFEHNGQGNYWSEERPTGEVIHHDEVTEKKWIIDSPAFTENIIDHFYCTCGQTKQP